VGNLFDGCYVFYSGINGVRNGAVGAAADGTVRFEGNLIKMENMPGPSSKKNKLGNRNSRGYGSFFKTQKRDGRLPSIVLRDNVRAFEVSPGRRRLGARFNCPHIRIADCANNTILWFGSGSFPADLPSGWDACFTIISGDEAKERWQTLRQQWIDAHPDIPRL